MDFVELIGHVHLENFVKFLDSPVFFDLPVLPNLPNLSGLQDLWDFPGFAEVPDHPENYGPLDFLRPIKPIELNL